MQFEIGKNDFSEGLESLRKCYRNMDPVILSTFYKISIEVQKLIRLIIQLDEIDPKLAGKIDKLLNVRRELRTQLITANSGQFSS